MPRLKKRLVQSLQNCSKRSGAVRMRLTCGQVAQLVERSPEKAGVGGSIPSLAIPFKNLQAQKWNLVALPPHFTALLTPVSKMP